MLLLSSPLFVWRIDIINEVFHDVLYEKTNNVMVVRILEGVDVFGLVKYIRSHPEHFFF